MKQRLSHGLRIGDKLHGTARKPADDRWTSENCFLEFDSDKYGELLYKVRAEAGLFWRVALSTSVDPARIHPLGQYIMMVTPISATSPPNRSNLSGITLSICQPQRIDRTMKMPPYAA